ncbi:hypothetical protein BKH37_06190 [Actinomyces naeslundii]|nr:hypothetical protein BKH37_06190 [Actinomyces naeslundii]
MSFFDALVYTLAYFPVISALARIDNPLPMPTTVHELRGQSYMRHRPSYAGILHESRRTLTRRSMSSQPALIPACASPKAPSTWSGTQSFLSLPPNLWVSLKSRATIPLFTAIAADR